MQNSQTVAQSNLGNLRISASTPTKAKIVKYYNPSDFVMCLIEDEEDEDLFSDVCMFSSAPTSVNVGEIVGIYEENKNEWTRGKVETIIVNKLYEVVTTVELGVIQVTIDKIRKLPQCLKRIKTEEVYCCLANVVPTSEDRSWSKKDCELFKTITKNKLFLVYGVRINARHFVRLFNEQGSDLGSLLSSIINAKVVSPLFRSPMEFWEENSSITTFVCAFDAPGHLWLVDDSLETMTVVKERLNNGKRLTPVNNNLVVGSVVAAKDVSGDKMFRRAVILEDYGVEWLVQYLDFGNKEVVKEIRKLPKELEFYPSMALSLTSTRIKERQRNLKVKLNQSIKIRVKLLNNIINVVNIEEFDDSLFIAMPFWNEIDSHENVCVHLENSSPEVELTPYEEDLVRMLKSFDTVNSGTPILERPINTPSDNRRSPQKLENSLKSIGSEPLISNEKVSESSANSLSVERGRIMAEHILSRHTFTFPPHQTCDKNQMYPVLIVTCSFTSGIINVQLQTEESRRIQTILGQRLNQVCEEELKSSREVQPYPKQYLCAKIEHDDSWHRCQVVKKIDNNTINVYFIDIGRYANLGTDHLVLLPGEFLHLPCATLGIKLANIEQTLLADVVKIFRERKSNLWFMKIVDNRRYPYLATLFTTDNLSLCSLLTESFNRQENEAETIHEVNVTTTNRQKVENSSIKSNSKSEKLINAVDTYSNQLEAHSRRTTSCFNSAASHKNSFEVAPPLDSTRSLRNRFVKVFQRDAGKPQCLFNIKEMQNEDLPLGAAEVVFTNVYGPQQMYCWFGDVKEIKERLNNLSTMMMNEFLVEQNDISYVPQLKEICIAESKGACFRAVCLKIGNPCKMFFLDYGLIQFVTPWKLRAMRKRFTTTIRFQAILCVLDGIDDERIFSEGECNLFQNLLVKGRSYKVTVIRRDLDAGYYSIKIPSIDSVFRGILVNK